MPVTVTEAGEPTTAAVQLKLALVSPAATTAEAGTDRAVLELLRVTVAPPGGAAPARVTVPVADAPEAMVLGSVTVARGTAFTSKPLVNCVVCPSGFVIVRVRRPVAALEPMVTNTWATVGEVNVTPVTVRLLPEKDAASR